MPKPAQKTQITVHVATETLSQLNEDMKDLNLRRDAYLNGLLRDEVKELLNDAVPANTEKSASFLAALSRTNKDKSKLVITLDKDVAEQLSAACKKKRISRDAFVESVIAFLTGTGDFEGNGGPLSAALVILENPRSWGGEALDYKSLLTMTDSQLNEIVRSALPTKK